MTAFLVTGNPGSGKSTIANELARRGLSTIDPDYDPELSYWEDQARNKVLLRTGPLHRTKSGCDRIAGCGTDRDLSRSCASGRGRCSCAASR